MRPEWITDAHDVWLHGDDVDLGEVSYAVTFVKHTLHRIQTVSKYRLPIFSGVTLSLSGIDDLEVRASINRALTKYGGTYVKAIERPVKVTHLCAGDIETEKMHYVDRNILSLKSAARPTFMSYGRCGLGTVWNLEDASRRNAMP